MKDLIKTIIETLLQGLLVASVVTFAAFVLLLLPMSLGMPFQPVWFGYLAIATLAVSWLYFFCDQHI